jgi:hypothetical protein
MYLWIKAFHIISVITWMAGIFYLPRLFVYHVTAKDDISNERFKVMEDKALSLDHDALDDYRHRAGRLAAHHRLVRPTDEPVDLDKNRACGAVSDFPFQLRPDD